MEEEGGCGGAAVAGAGSGSVAGVREASRGRSHAGAAGGLRGRRGAGGGRSAAKGRGAATGGGGRARRQRGRGGDGCPRLVGGAAENRGGPATSACARPARSDSRGGRSSRAAGESPLPGDGRVEGRVSTKARLVHHAVPRRRRCGAIA